jgi:predicted amidophosphoribosyltransferase
MIAELESRVERTVAISKITPARAAETLCSHCLRPLYGELDYICENCGANHYKNEFYICCPVDAEKPLTVEGAV